MTVVKSHIGKDRLLQAGRDKAKNAVDFINLLKHSTGAYAGKPFQLMPWQENDIIRRFYGTLNPDGTRQYRTVWIEVPRKNGKTELGAGGFALPMLYLDGEFGAQIYSAANDREQAGLIFNAAYPMVTQDQTLIKASKVYEPQKRIVFYQPGPEGTPIASFYAAISAESYTKDGLNSHCVIYDELHAAKNRDLWDVLKTSFGSRRQPAMVVTTTAGYDRNTICWELHNYACKVRDGIVKDPTWLVCIYAADEKEDWTNEDVWRKCNPALGVFRNIEEMRSECKQAIETPAYEMTFRRLYLNQWTTSVARWMPIDTWDACGVEQFPNIYNRPCYGGLDLSSTTDLCALSFVWPLGEGRFAVKWDFWIPEDNMRERERKDGVPYALWVREGFVHATPGNVLDYNYILHDIDEKITSGIDIRELAFDRWGSQKLVADMVNLGFQVDPKVPGRYLIQFGQGYASMSPPTKELMTLCLQKNLIHDNNPVARWNMDNLVVTQDPAGNLKPDKAKATQRIDGAVAMIMALDRATKHQQKVKSVYETRGALIL